MRSVRGRGLTIDDPIAGPADTEPGPHSGEEGRLRNIALAAIHPNPGQPRKRMDQDALCSLAESISERGVLQPVIVRPRKATGYELVAGERRWRAAGIAGCSTIPALVEDAVDGAQALELALIENVVREDLTAIEEARTIATLLNDLKITGSALAKRLGRSRTDLAHTTRLLELPDEVIGLVDRGTLSKGHGKALLTEPDHQRRRALGRLAAKQGWSVRRLEAEMATARNPRGVPPEAHPDQLATAAGLEEGIARATGREARARPHREGYQITIDQAGAEALARLLAARGGAP